MHNSYRALRDGIQAIRLDPKSAQAFANRGLAYLLKANYTRTIADLTEATRLDPRLSSQLGSILTETNEKLENAKLKASLRDQARTNFQQADSQ